MAAANQSGRRSWAAIGIGVVACVGCCAALPLLAAFGLSASGTVLVGIGWLVPVGIALVLVGLVGVVVSRTRRPPGATCCVDRRQITRCSCRSG